MIVSLSIVLNKGFRCNFLVTLSRSDESPVLDPNNLSVHQNLPLLDLPKMANGIGNWQMWQCLIWSSYWGLEVSEFN